LVQNKRSLVELCILALLHKEPQYGYDLSTTIANLINVSDGTIYPILRKLKVEGIVTTFLAEGQGGPPRKYYQITKMGEEQYQFEKKNWQMLFHNVGQLMED